MPIRPDDSLPPRARLKWRTSVVAPGKLAAIAGMLEPGETVLWAGAPDTLSTLRTQRVLWWVGVPWTAIALTLLFFQLIPNGWALFVIAPGLVFVAAPFLLVVYAGGTIYAITDRRAIIKHAALGKQQNVSVAFADMDDKLEILQTRPGIGHLYFASGLPGKLSDVDYTGKLAFREIAKPEDVAQLLDRIRAQGKSE